MWWLGRQVVARLAKYEVQFRVRFGANMNTARKQHVIFTVWYISLSREVKTLFQNLFSGTVMDTSFVISTKIFPRQFHMRLTLRKFI